MRAVAFFALVLAFVPSLFAQDGVQVPLTPESVRAALGNAGALCDEQDAYRLGPKEIPKSQWNASWKAGDYPVEAEIDLGSEREIVSILLFDSNGKGPCEVAAGAPGNWQPLFTDPCSGYQVWNAHPVNVTARYLRVIRHDGGANVAEIVVFERSQAEKTARAEAARRPLVDAGPLFGKLPLVDEIRCGDPADRHALVEEPAGASRVETILGQACRTLPNTGDTPKFFAYRIAPGCYLEPGKAYLLTLEYPEDQPRTTYVLHRGCETIRGFHTGTTVGDALHAKYVNSNPESLAIPLAGEYRTWSMLFYLHDRFADIHLARDGAARPLRPIDGFPVIVAHPTAKDAPLSAGAAVARIRLFAVPDPSAWNVRLRLPEGLPRRHLFFREEMSDGVVQSRDPAGRGVTDDAAWFEYKARLMQFLGMNTLSKDLLEFGHNQGWDAEPGWINLPPFGDRWEKIVQIAGRHGLDLLPYYEYCGSIGPKGLGNQKRCRPLASGDDYTHITWSEKANADVTDPDTLADVCKILDLTITRFKDRAPFVGAWLRPRVSGMPISFSDRCLALYAQETGAALPARETLAADPALREPYYQWWLGKRRAFLLAVRDHLRSRVSPDAVVLFTGDTTEPGTSFRQWDAPMVAENVEAWKETGENVVELDKVVRENWYGRAMAAPPLTWGKWEWQHACPRNDPEHYRTTDGVLLTYTFNRAYTVASSENLDGYRTASGLAMIRHYCLNEDILGEKLGYFVCDVERAGPWCMLAEARAVAYGDPFYLGYLTGSSFNRGFPEYVRAFNAAFLALPALPSQRLPDACADKEIVVRAIRTEKHGTYLAVVNVGYRDAQASVRMPAAGAAVDAATGEAIAVRDGQATLPLHPCQLRSLWIAP